MAKRKSLEEIELEHTAVDIKFDEALRLFKPKFGNLKHLAVRDAVALANEMEKEARNIIEKGRGGAKALHDVIKVKRHVLELLT